MEKHLARYVKNPRCILASLGQRGLLNWLDDERYLKLLFSCRMGYPLDLDNPKTFNEKLQWLKIHDRDPRYTMMVDKYAVRQWVADSIGEEHLIPLIGVWDSFEEIDFDSLPERFVLKCTHDSGSTVLCKDKAKFDSWDRCRFIRKRMSLNYYALGREWPYRNVKPRIIAEELMVDESGTELKDYKFFCFDGEPKVLLVATGRQIENHVNFYDMRFNRIPLKITYPNTEQEIKRPPGFDEMLHYAQILSRGIRHVRVDFYDVNGRVYFGEMTFYHLGGMGRFDPPEYDRLWGDWIRLSD
ncbi:MAG: ATP-grasp fold amidoligase family protein [Bacillota bacterium]